MKHLKTKLIASFLFCFGLTGLQAQESVLTSGGDATGSGGSVSYSVGQIVYTTNTGTNGSVAQGVQQPFEISTVTAIEEAKGIILNCSAYPNPATNFLTLKMEDYKIENLSYQIYDINGKFLSDQKINSNETLIPMESMPSANYFLKVIQGDKEIKTFKIIKN